MGRVQPIWNERQDRGAASVQAERTELLALKSLVLELKWQLALRRFARKYEGQPRDELGRFAEEDGVTDFSAARRPSKALLARCAAQLAVDTIVCSRASPSRVRACRAQAMVRYAACLRGREPPPLNY